MSIELRNERAEEDRHLASVRAWVAERLGIELGRELPSADFGEPASPEA